MIAYFFDAGRMLDCTADIVLELPNIKKVTPAMLTSAQTFVARSMEEQWYDGMLELENITLLFLA